MNATTRFSVWAVLVIMALVTSVSVAASNPVASTLGYDSTKGYYNPPTWGAMVMVNITFDGNNVGWVPSSYDFTVGPILKAASANIANPTTFDPNMPWSVLNGTAFSRQLGWYDSIGDDFNASHAASLGGNFLWIEKVSGSPELKTYSVSEANMTTGPYTPIFGTAGSSTKWKWDGFMDHNAYAVNLSDLREPNQVFDANYKLYIGDANGNEILLGQTPKYGSLAVTWSWIGPAVVPKPATCILLLGGAAALIARKKRPSIGQ